MSPNECQTALIGLAGEIRQLQSQTDDVARAEFQLALNKLLQIQSVKFERCRLYPSLKIIQHHLSEVVSQSRCNPMFGTRVVALQIKLDDTCSRILNPFPQSHASIASNRELDALAQYRASL